MKYSIILPVYNEADNIELLYTEIAEVMNPLSGDYEILWVNDGSTDQSLRILQDLKKKDSRNRILNFAENCGQTAAMGAGFRSAKGDVFITMDSDLQNDPHDIPKMLLELEYADMIAGWRFDRQDNWVRKLSSKVGNSIRNWFTEESISDTGCSLKIYKRVCLDRIKLYEGMHRFLPTLIRYEGFKIKEVKVHHRPRKYGKAKYGVLNRAFVAFLDLLAVCWMKHRNLHYRQYMKEIDV